MAQPTPIEQTPEAAAIMAEIHDNEENPQEAIEQRLLEAAVAEARIQYAQAKVSHHLARAGIGAKNHLNQVATAEAQTKKQLEILEAFVELGHVPETSPIEVAEAGIVVPINRAERRAQAKGKGPGAA